MPHSHSARRSIAALAALVVLGATTACGGSGDSTAAAPPPSIVGSYVATTFQVTPIGQPAIDVLARGGTLALVIAADNSTTGSLSLPPSILGSPFSATLTGTAVQTGNTVKFEQSADTFVRDLTFTVSGSTLQATNQPAGVGTFTIVLTRQ
ncbi:MAG TPA: hypothetical protein VGP25_11235 [Gemmatimonadaceae bacterium]|nr:hypothetical protein [Gemmatimonadaceae bacterium]